MDDLYLSYSSDYPGRMVPAQRNKDIQLPTLYLVKELDYYARTEQWDKLLSAPLRSDKNAMHACFQNLALAQKVFWPTKHYRSNK